MMLKAIFRPLEKWPGTSRPAAARRHSPFQADYNSTLDLLEFELDQIGAQNITIQAQADRSQIRNDGWLKGGVTLAGPAVVVSFTGRDGHQYSYPCDTFTEYAANLRAIALGLEALRKVDRYGITRRGEQYQGFRELPAAAGAHTRMSPEEAAKFIWEIFPAVSPDALLSVQKLFEVALTEAQKRAHPDRPDLGGSTEKFQKLQEAADVIAAHFKSKGAGA